MASKIGIINRALMQLGESPVADLGPNAPQKILSISKLYDDYYKELLGDYKWNFSKYITELSKLSSFTSVDNWQYAYQIPSDYLQIDHVFPNVKYEIYGDKIYCNKSDGLKLVYFKVVPEAYLPPYFIEYLSSAMTAGFCMPITSNPQLMQYWSESAKSSKIKALIIDKQNDTAPRLKADGLRIARYGFGA